MTKQNLDSITTIEESLERYKNVLAPEYFYRLREVSKRPSFSAIRMNLLKSPDPDRALGRMAEIYQWKTRELTFLKTGWQLLDYGIAPSQTLEHRLGYYYIQDASSMLPVALFNAANTNLLKLDLAASPGGKTTQLIDNHLDQDLVLANDSSLSRLQALKTVLQTWGAINYGITNYPGELMGDWFPNTFDQVLLDAPCSMESLRVSPTHPYRPITAAERERLANRQLALLISAVKAAKIGGEIVYSTCTLAPEEDEAVLDSFLKTHPGTVEVEQIDRSLIEAPGLTAFEGKYFDYLTERSLRIWPFEFDTNGFFAVKLVKTTPLPHNIIRPPTRPFKKTGLEQISDQDFTTILDQVESAYDFDLGPLLIESELQIYRRDQTILILPNNYIKKFTDLPYYALGMPMAKLIKGKLEVSSDFINRFSYKFGRNVWTLPANRVSEWLNGMDLRTDLPTEFQAGTIIAVRDTSERSLGGGKLLEGRLRNLLPRRNLRN